VQPREQPQDLVQVVPVHLMEVTQVLVVVVLDIGVEQKVEATPADSVVAVVPDTLIQVW
jgi:hypothetical protein